MASRENVGMMHQTTKTYGLRVNNLPHDITKAQLRLYFDEHGGVESVVVIKRGPSECHGFVNYWSLSLAQQMAEIMNGSLIGGKLVECRANTKPRYTRSRRAPGDHKPSTTTSPTISSRSSNTHPKPISMAKQPPKLNPPSESSSPISKPTLVAKKPTPIDPTHSQSSTPNTKQSRRIKLEPQNSSPGSKSTSAVNKHSDSSAKATPSPVTKQPVCSSPCLTVKRTLAAKRPPPIKPVQSSNPIVPTVMMRQPPKPHPQGFNPSPRSTSAAKQRHSMGGWGREESTGGWRGREEYTGGWRGREESTGGWRGSKESTAGWRRGECTSKTCETSCTTLIALLLSNEYKPQIDQLKKTHNVSVTITECKIIISGKRGSEEVAKDHLTEVLENIKSKICHKDFVLPFHSIPLFEQDAAMRELKEIEAKHSVEFSVIKNTRQTSMESFSTDVKRSFSRVHNDDSIPPTYEGLTPYFSECQDGASRYGGRAADVQWFYRDDDGIFVEYTTKDSAALELMFQIKTARSLCIKGNQYSFNFSTMTQCNISTQRSRPIQRHVKTTDIKRVLNLQVSGLTHHSLYTSISRLQDAVKGTTAVKECRFHDGTSEEFKKRLMTTVNKYFITLQGVEGGLKLTGVRGYVERVHLVAEQEKLSEREAQIHAAIGVTESELPPHWTPQTEEVALDVVKRGSKEWMKEYDRFRMTLRGVTIVKLERVQNKWLWERYSFAKKRMDTRNRGYVNEKHLFHGTRTTSPENVYKSEKGVDFRYSREGLWGTGAYFAVNASYSDSYAYSTPGGVNEKQMFICKVLTGDAYDAGSTHDSSLRQPPLKPGQNAEEKRHDSVKGHTNGSNVYVVYDHEKVYPAYLLTYYKSDQPYLPSPHPPILHKIQAVTALTTKKKDSCIIS